MSELYLESTLTETLSEITTNQNTSSNQNSNINESSSLSAQSSKKIHKPKVGYTFDERMLLHKDITLKHQECPERLMSIYINLFLKNLTNSLIKIPSIESSENEILKVHSSSYLNEIKNLQYDSNGNPRDKNISSHTLKEKDSYDNYATFESAKVACGSLINSINYILDKKIDYAFNIIRPPGHHANQSNCKGFCIFNSIAIGVEYLKSKFPDKKIVIIDWDVHHGDGTQKIFYDKKNPLFISIHRHDKGKFYPQITGFSKEIGEKEGEGYNINIPLDTKCNITNGSSCIGDAEYIEIFDKVIIKILNEYQPDFIFVSCGFDAGENDLSGQLKCTPISFMFMTKKLINFGKNIIFALEGGYTIDTIMRCSETVVRTLLFEDNSFKNCLSGNYCDFKFFDWVNNDKIIKDYEKIFKPVFYVMEQVNEGLKDYEKYWKCLENVGLRFLKEKEFLRKDDFDKNNDILKKVLLDNNFIIENKEDFIKENEDYIIFKIGKNLINENKDENKYLRKKILSYRTVQFELGFNIESIKFTKLRANATKISKLLNWNRDEMKYDMNNNVISEILSKFFQNLNVKNKDIIKFLDEIINKVKTYFENDIDIYNCDFILVPKIINIEKNKKDDEKKKFKIVRKSEKAVFTAFVNGVKNKNIYFYQNGKDNNKNFINGLYSLRNFIKENVMN
jgi:histone deacetylase 6